MLKRAIVALALATTLLPAALAGGPGDPGEDLTTIEVIPFEDDGWQYTEAAPGECQNFHEFGYEGDCTFETASAPFGDGSWCSPDHPDPATHWDGSNDVLIHQVVPIPPDAINPRVNYIVDNSVEIWVSNPLESRHIGEQSHGRCQLEGSMDVGELAPHLKLSLRASDISLLAYLDAQLVYELPVDEL